MGKETVVGISSTLAKGDLFTVLFAGADFAFVNDAQIGGLSFGAESGNDLVGGLVFDFQGQADIGIRGAKFSKEEAGGACHLAFG